MNKRPLKHVIFWDAIKDKHHIVACQIISLELLIIHSIAVGLVIEIVIPGYHCLL
jgi:hypothetical protein